MTTTEAFEQMLSKPGSTKELGLRKDFFTRLRIEHKRGQVTLNRMEFALIKTGYYKAVQESWSKVKK